MPCKPTHIPYGLSDPAKRYICNPGIKDEAELVKYGIETNGEYFYVKVVVGPGGGALVHRHYGYGEKFYPIEGDLGVLGHNGTKTMTLKKGETYHVQPGEWHRFFNPSQTENIVFEAKVEPAHAGFEKSLYIWYGIAADGHADATGAPKSLLHFLMLASMGDMSTPGLGGWLLGLVVALAGWIGWITGEEERLTRKYYGKPVGEATDEVSISDSQPQLMLRMLTRLLSPRRRRCT